MNNFAVDGFERFDFEAFTRQGARGEDAAAVRNIHRRVAILAD